MTNAAAATDRAAASLLLRSYQQVQAALLTELASVLRRVETPAQARRSRRVQELLIQVEQQIAAWTAIVEQQVTAGQRQAIAAASANPLPPAVNVTWNKLPVAAFEDLVGRLADGTPLADWLEQFGAEARQAAREALITGLGRGAGVRQIAANVRRALNTTAVRALLTSRQAILSSYRQAALANYRNNNSVIKAWRWSASLSTRACAACWALHGQEFPLSEPFASHPACRCAPVGISRSYAELGIDGIPEPEPPPKGADVFATLSEADQRRILGPNKLRLYQEGRLRLADLVVETDGGRWPPGKREATLRELIA